tara:strand:- start:426 stop:629 length:204 start_codon:yes stop_codon:yes gene_type:complete
MKFLIFYTRCLIILSYLIVGLFIVDMAQTTKFIDMDFIDWLICSIGSIFIFFSMFLLYVFSQIKKGV